MDSPTTQNDGATVKAIVEHNYRAKESDELTLTKGAIITNVKRQSGGWWEGTVAGITGMFPDNFVRVLDADDKSPVVLRDKSESKNRRFKAVYSYTQNNNDELTLAVGDVIEFLGEVEEGWWRGKLSGRTGVFPSNFVEPCAEVSPVLVNRRLSHNDSNATNNTNARHSLRGGDNAKEERRHSASDKDAPSLPPKPVREQCRVIYPYKQANEDELDLREGDVITVINKDLPDKGWWKGELKGKVGVFPDNFVQIVPGDGSPAKDPSHTTPERPPSTTKLHINNSSSDTHTNNSAVKSSDSFGSRNSLNDAIPTGNVAAYRKSLENKFADHSDSNLPIAMRKSPSDIKSELRKSLDNLDERKTTPPPALLKKPAIPIKKSPTVGTVASNIFGGLKKAKGDTKTAAAADNLDGMGGSKPNSHVADNGDKGVVGERIQRGDESEFDQIGRNSSILPDVRQQRAKAPKRRLPTSNSGSLGDGVSNGDAGLPPTAPPITSSSPVPLNKSEEDLTKPRQREWEKNRAPWMAELKASQAKKTSPGLEAMRTAESMDSAPELGHGAVRDNHIELRSSSIDIKSSGEPAFRSNSFKSERSGGAEQQHAVHRLSTTTKISISDAAAPADDGAKPTNNSVAIKPRPTSVQLRSINLPPPHSRPAHDGPNVLQTSTATITKAVTTLQDDAGATNHAGVHLTTVTGDNVCAKFAELELRVQTLEKLVQKQNLIIEDLQKHMKDESDKVKTLKRELDKYAQCVTQV